MQRGSSRLKASIFFISSSNPLTKASSLETLSETFPIIETSRRKSLTVLGRKVGLKFKLSSGGTEPISEKSLLSYQNSIKKMFLCLRFDQGLGNEADREVREEHWKPRSGCIYRDGRKYIEKEMDSKEKKKMKQKYVLCVCWDEIRDGDWDEKREVFSFDFLFLFVWRERKKERNMEKEKDCLWGEYLETKFWKREDSATRFYLKKSLSRLRVLYA